MVGLPTKRRCLRSEVQLSRDCADRFKRNLHGKTARSVLCLTVKVASARTSVRAMIYVPPTKHASGDNNAQTLRGLIALPVKIKCIMILDPPWWMATMMAIISAPS